MIMQKNVIIQALKSTFVYKVQLLNPDTSQ